jgi:hypothetical protein
VFTQDTSVREKLGRGRERERKREKLRSRDILSFLERKCPVENVLNSTCGENLSRKERMNLCETFSLFLSLSLFLPLSLQLRGLAVVTNHSREVVLGARGRV